MAKLINFREPTVCTDVAASWCPNCGDCTCPRDEDGERAKSPNCPLHGRSPHASLLTSFLLLEPTQRANYAFQFAGQRHEPLVSLRHLWEKDQVASGLRHKWSSQMIELIPEAKDKQHARLVLSATAGSVGMPIEFRCSVSAFLRESAEGDLWQIVPDADPHLLAVVDNCGIQVLPARDSELLDDVTNIRPYQQYWDLLGRAMSQMPGFRFRESLDGWFFERALNAAVDVLGQSRIEEVLPLGVAVEAIQYGCLGIPRPKRLEILDRISRLMESSVHAWDVANYARYAVPV